ncbi:MAG: PilZ domain-containing protein [Deltaproteobacteria bacterium]|nr:PilZ domain-containing protein [Deltaproteobacteria bacterium]
MSVKKRFFTRHPIALRVRVRTPSGWTEMSTVDVSRRGVFLRTDEPLDERRIAQLRISMPSGKELDAMGHVRRVVREETDGLGGMGIEFFVMSKEAEDEWDRFVLEQSRRPSSAATVVPGVDGSSSTPPSIVLEDSKNAHTMSDLLVMELPVIRETIDAPLPAARRPSNIVNEPTALALDGKMGRDTNQALKVIADKRDEHSRFVADVLAETEAAADSPLPAQGVEIHVRRSSGNAPPASLFDDLGDVTSTPPPIPDDDFAPWSNPTPSEDDRPAPRSSPPRPLPPAPSAISGRSAAVASNRGLAEREQLFDSRATLAESDPIPTVATHARRAEPAPAPAPAERSRLDPPSKPRLSRPAPPQRAAVRSDAVRGPATAAAPEKREVPHNEAPKRAAPAISEDAPRQGDGPTVGPDGPGLFITVRPGDVEHLRQFIDRRLRLASVFLRSNVPCAPGQPVDVAVVHPESDAEVLVSGTVARVIRGETREENGFLLRFDEVDGDVKASLVHFVNTGHPEVRAPTAMAEAAIDDLRQAAEDEPESSAAWMAYGWTLLAESENPVDAVEAFQRALMVAPDLPAIHDAIALAYALSGDTPKAYAFIRSSRQLHEESDT